MKKLLKLIVVIALLDVFGNVALADSPAFSAQPDVRPDPNGSTAGGSASVTGGSAGPATVTSSQPITASSSNTTAPNSPTRGSTSANGPGTTATVPTNAMAAQPNPSSPDGSAPTTSGPSANADASRSSVSTSDSRVRANAIATATGAFGGRMAGIGSAEDPTYAATCSTADASPGVPTDASLGTSCGNGPSTASEDFSANRADGNGSAGTPSGSSCLGATTSAGPSPTADLSSPCTQGSGATSSTPSGAGNGGANRAAVDGSSTAGTGKSASVLGLESLPSTATAPASLALLGAAFSGLGVLLLRAGRRKI